MVPSRAVHSPAEVPSRARPLDLNDRGRPIAELADVLCTSGSFAASRASPTPNRSWFSKSGGRSPSVSGITKSGTAACPQGDLITLHASVKNAGARSASARASPPLAPSNRGRPIIGATVGDRQSVFGWSFCLRPTVAGSTLGDFHFRGHNAFTVVTAR